MKQLKKRGFYLASRCPLCGAAEEEFNLLLVHCPSIWGLWEGLIPFQGQLFLIKEMLMGWIWFPFRKKQENFGWQHHYAFYGRFGRKGIRYVFEEMEFSISMIKASFISSLTFQLGILMWGIALLLDSHCVFFSLSWVVS